SWRYLQVSHRLPTGYPQDAPDAIELTLLEKLAMPTSPEQVEHLTNLSKAKGFLGREFLTWLWYMAETYEDHLTTSGPSGEEIAFDIWVDDRLVLEATGGSASSHENVMKGGDPSQSYEAAAALGTGKTVKELKLGINAKGYGEFTAI